MLPPSATAVAALASVCTIRLVGAPEISRTVRVLHGENNLMSRVRIGDAEIAFEKLGHAGPVIVFELGLGQDMRDWEAVAQPLAAWARPVLYDRPGIGRSGPRDGIRALLASTVADQLHALLNAIDAPRPYILVGHSLGGFYMQAFARNTRTRPRRSCSSTARARSSLLASSAPPFPRYQSLLWR